MKCHTCGVANIKDDKVYCEIKGCIELDTEFDCDSYAPKDHIEKYEVEIKQCIELAKDKERARINLLPGTNKQFVNFDEMESVAREEINEAVYHADRLLSLKEDLEEAKQERNKELIKKILKDINIEANLLAIETIQCIAVSEKGLEMFKE